MRAEQKSFHRLWPAEVCTFAADSRRGLISRLERFAAFLRIEKPTTPTIKDVAHTLNVLEAAPSGATFRLAFVASTLAEAAERVTVALERLGRESCKRIKDPRGIYYFANPPKPEGGLAFLYPGEGSQYAGMLAELCLWFPAVREWFDRMDRAFADHPRGCVPSHFVFPAPGPEMPDALASDRLWETDGAVEAVFTASQALTALLATLGIRPDAAAGHSAGDYSALFASGAIETRDEVQFIRQARELNGVYEEFARHGGVPEGVLLAVNSADPGLPAAVLEQSRNRLHLALDNSPHQVVLCGAEDLITLASQTLRRAGALCETLPFRRAYHTPLFEPVSARLLEVLQTLTIRPPRLPVYSGVNARPYPENADEIRQLMAAQWSCKVRLRETIEAMYDSGTRIFAEVGPSGNLTAFVEDTLRGRPNLAVAANLKGRSAITQLQHFAGLLFAAGVPVRLEEFYARREPAPVSLDGQSKPQTARPGDSVRLALRLPSLRLSPRPAPAIQQSSPEQTNVREAADSPPAASPPRPPARKATVVSRAPIPDSFFQNTLHLLEVEREVMTAYFDSRPAAVAPSGPPVDEPVATPVNLPFVREIVRLVPGREATVLCEIDLREDLFLLQHTLAGKISLTDENLAGLPVVPLTFSMEMLAEVASVLRPGRVVVGMRDIRAARWLIVEQERLRLEVHAWADDADGDVQVTLRETTAEGVGPRHDTAAVEGTVIFGAGYADGGQRTPLAVSNEHPSKWRPGKMYDGTGMFHGPLFQVVSSMERTGSDGAEALLTGGPINGLFRTRPAHWLIDPVVLDAMGQVVGYWIGDQFDTGLSVFPFRLARLDLHRGPLESGEMAKCRLRICSLNDEWMKSDIEVCGKDGVTFIRMTGWEDRRLDLPRRFYDFRISAADILLSDLPPNRRLALPESGGLRIAVLKGLPEEVFQSHGSIWLLVMAYMILNRTERESWRPLRGKRRFEWLLGRIAAKDAVRALLRDGDGLRLCPADIEIAAHRLGAPEVAGDWTNRFDAVPLVSIAHAAGLAVAVAGRGSEYTGIGVDVERIGRITGEVERLVLSVGERDLLTAMDSRLRSEWATRLWCAKEAVGKALGKLAIATPADVEARAADLSTGRVTVQLSPALSSHLPEIHQTDVSASTTVEGDHALATAWI